MGLTLAKGWSGLGVEAHDAFMADGAQFGGCSDEMNRASVTQNWERHQFGVGDAGTGGGRHFIKPIIVSPISAGVFATAMPQASSVLIFSAAVPEPPLMIAPA